MCSGDNQKQVTTMTEGLTAALSMTAPTARPFGPRREVNLREGVFAAEYPFASKWFNAGTDAQPLWMHYIDEGPRDAPVLVFAHGNPTWSFYWRKAVLHLRDKFRCIAMDHVGMGLSDRPQWPRYVLADHIDRARRLLDALQLSQVHYIGHDWGGCIVAGLAVQRPQDALSMTWMNTGAFVSADIPFTIAMCRWPVFGRLAVLQGNAFAGVASWRAVKRSMSAAVKQGYLAPYGNAHDRIATLRFVEDIPLQEDHPSRTTLANIEKGLSSLRGKPITLFWGDDDFCFTPKFRQRFEAEFPDAVVHAWPDAGHYVMEDAGERILPLLRARLLAASGMTDT
jgi:cis-3-alkyl-4-acyloxetan-2-one decarboxylase